MFGAWLEACWGPPNLGFFWARYPEVHHPEGSGRCHGLSSGAVFLVPPEDIDFSEGRVLTLDIATSVINDPLSMVNVSFQHFSTIICFYHQSELVVLIIDLWFFNMQSTIIQNYHHEPWSLSIITGSRWFLSYALPKSLLLSDPHYEIIRTSAPNIGGLVVHHAKDHHTILYPIVGYYYPFSLYNLYIVNPC